jgi:DNA-directed RNA polymerase subunit RPC12/RpoP
MDCMNCESCLSDKLDESGWPILATRMIVCPSCGNKRCPKATDHNLKCTSSNEPGQKGSSWENYKI